MRKLLTIGMCAMLGMFGTACSDDDIDNGSVVNEQQKTGESAYLSVNIIVSDSQGTRADGGDSDASTDDPTLEFGDLNEHNVTNVKFYFFDENNKFVSVGSVYNDEWEDGDKTTNNNIEYIGKNIVVVPNATSEKPSKVVTVVNPPSGFSLKDGGESLSDFFNALTTWESNGGFVMTTTSYFADLSNASSDTYYYVTTLTDDDFFSTASAAAAATSSLNIYVERLAVKADVKFADLKRFVDDAKTIYQLGRFQVNNDKYYTFYAKFVGWGLNAVSHNSYFVKHLDPTWTLKFNWNDAARYRSYWAKSTAYSNGNWTFPDHYYTALDSNDSTLDFISQSNIQGKKLDFSGKTYDYCNENTNTAEYINQHHIPGIATHVLLLAQLTDKSGNPLQVDGEDLVKFNNKYYTRTGVVKAIIGNLETKNYVDADGNALSSDDVELVNDEYLNGHICPQLTTAGAAKTWKDGMGAEVTADAINKLFSDYVDNSNDKEIIGYTGGYMYYYATIKHLAQDIAPTKKTDGSTLNNGLDYVEGYYGVVRNHWYELTITGFGTMPSTDKNDPNYDPSWDPEKNPDPTDPDPFDDSNLGDDDPAPDNVPNIDPGHGIEDPDEPIVPNPDKNSDYYLNANINILSWRLVGQDVKL